MNVLNRQLPVALILILFGGFWYINYLVPMHSDDFFYKIMGLGIEQHLQHYRSWSGRLVADHISPAILSLGSKPLIALLQTVGLFSLVWVLAVMPNQRRATPWVFLMVFALYFVSSPGFGQINLWVVGSANYMWTALLYCSYLLVLLRFLETGRVPLYAYPLALLAGCTNESAVVCIALFSVLVLAWQRFTQKRVNKSLVAYVALFMLGAAVLLNSPGNQARLEMPVFEAWAGLGFFEKIELHLAERFFPVFAASKAAYAAGVLALLAGLWVKRFNLFENSKPSNMLFAVMFMLMAIGANFIMAMSPVFPTRAMGVPFVFVLVSFSFSLAALLSAVSPPRARLLSAPPGLAAFVVSSLYIVAILPAYLSFHQQDAFRKQVVFTQAHDGALAVPDFYFRWMPDPSFEIDRYANMEFLSKYYGLGLVDRVNYNFDYSVLSKPPHGRVLHNGEQAAYEYYRYSEKFGFTDGFVIAVPADAGDIVFTRVQVAYEDGRVVNTADFAFHSTAFGDFLAFHTASSPFSKVKNVSVESFPLAGFDNYIKAKGMQKAGVDAPYDIYVGNRRILYASRSCPGIAGAPAFFLHVLPVQNHDLPEDRQPYGFDNLDFSFRDRGAYHKGDFCMIERELPAYPIGQLNTGQFDANGQLWSVAIEVVPR